MPRYEPIDAGIEFKVSHSDLAAFCWKTNGITADFILPDDEAHLLRVTFGLECIVRILDEFPLSTEKDDSPAEGLISEHFAYRIYGSAFSRIQSEAWMDSATVEGRSPIHYRFVTGWACLDVISAAFPTFLKIDR